MATPTGPQSQITCETPSSISDEAKDACNLTALSIFPDADHDWLGTVCSKHGYNAELAIAHIADLLEDGKSYPKRARQRQKRKRSSSSEDVREQVGKRFSGQGYRDKCMTKAYETTAKHTLRKGFPFVKVRTLDSMFVLNDRSTFQTCLAVQKMLSDPDAGKYDLILKKSVKKSDNDLENAISSAVGEEREVLEELLAAFSVGQAEKDAPRRLDQGRNIVQDEQENLALAKATGPASECGCCFEEFARNQMVYCNSLEPHFFCRQCFTSEAARLVGLNKFRIERMSMDGDCPMGFSRIQMLQLDSKLRFALERVEQDEAIREARLENLETCPFCPYAEEYPPINLDKEFRCRNPDCEIISCRSCRLETHIPKTCAEAAEDNAKDDIVSARHAIEEAMSSAMIRHCNKCKTPFIKEYGCNQMRCTKPSCRNMQCYICHKSCQYDHFDHMSYGGKPGNCPLFEQDVEKRHEDEVSAAEELARQAAMTANPQLDREALKIEFSLQVEQDEKNRKLARDKKSHGIDAARHALQARPQAQRQTLEQARLIVQQALERNKGANQRGVIAHDMSQSARQPINSGLALGAPIPAQHPLVPALPLQLAQPIPAQGVLGQRPQIYPPIPYVQISRPVFYPWAFQKLGALPAISTPRLPPAAPQGYSAALGLKPQRQAIPSPNPLGNKTAQVQALGGSWDYSQYTPKAEGAKVQKQQQRPAQQYQSMLPSIEGFDRPGQSLLAQHLPIFGHGAQQNMAASQLGSQQNPIDLDAGVDYPEHT
ncbi:hypothetical protein PpBr36_01214 [Pyricularia pennisetigena]|uniref:hypothetical protein n=1 Tax=Pyricularia pennisetigena TaxID=1578925 RepID=UPI00114EF190|nr:hypothetical protein PpBr36_01214 [Pyricularia pennisetigena]TLS28795.1 hypothetical protein PpBr36_01214 [Pyricularia pennisetigena]